MTRPEDDDWARKRVLITGGAGFVGVALCQFLESRGSHVHVLDNLVSRDATAHRELMKGRPTFVCDLRNPDEVARVVRIVAPDVVFHLAALHYIPACRQQPSVALSTNVLGTQHVLDALRGRATRLVLASTADVYAPSEQAHVETDELAPDNVYGLSKLTCESLCRYAGNEYGLDHVVARLFNVYGPGETNPHVIPEIIDQLMVGDVVRLGNIRPRRDYVFVNDVAVALAGLATHAANGSAINIGTGKSYSVDGVVRALGEILGRRLDIEADPSRMRKSDRMNLQANTDRLRELLPHLRFMSLEEGLSRLARHAMATASAPLPWRDLAAVYP